MKLYLFLFVTIIFSFSNVQSDLLEYFVRDLNGNAVIFLSNLVNNLIRFYEKWILRVDDKIWDIKEEPGARLSEIPEWKIGVLEAGQPETENVDIPLLAVGFQGSMYDWRYTMEPQDNALWGLIDRRMPCPRGKALGGSSVLNYMIYSRGVKEDYDKWEEMGNKGWSYEDVLPYFLKSEGAHGIRKIDKKFHNDSGPLSVENSFQSSFVKAVLEGGREIGLDYVDYNSPLTPIGVSPTQSTLRNGRRWSTGRAFLAPISKRDNLDVVINALVTKILINETTKEAYGVQYEKNGETRVALARKEVILCAGAINSPQLLMLSGIGPRDHLESLGIKVIKNLPVGKEMMDHLVFYGTMFPVFFDWDQTWLGYTLSIKDFVEKGEGPFSTLGGVEGVGFIKTNLSCYAPDSPDIEFLLVRGYLGTDHGTYAREAFRITDELYSYTFEPLETEPVWTIAPVLLQPQSVGKVLLRSADPHDPPLIYGNYYSDENNEDIKRMIAGIRVIEKFQDTIPFRSNGAKLSPFPVYGCHHIEFDTDDYWECALRTVSLTLYHPMRTCKMGPKHDKSAVVDNKLDVYGIKKLKVADASIMPFISGHSNAPAIMIGEKVSDYIKKCYNKL